MSANLVSIALYAAFAFLGALPLLARADDWYSSEGIKCSTTSIIAADLPYQPEVSAQLMDGKKGSYFSVKKAFLNTLLAHEKGAATFETPLSATQIAALKSDLSAQSDGLSFGILSLEAAVNLLKVDGVFTIAGGMLSKWLSSELGARQADIHVLQSLVTDGGNAFSVVAFKSPPGVSYPYLFVLRGYNVQVGAEKVPRSYVFEACFLPVEVDVETYETKSEGPNANNKKISKQANGTYKVFDITDQKWDSGTLRRISQDPTASIFATYDDSRMYRISTYGGPMETKDDTSDWRILYPKVESY
ncbi:MAG: hypothetical protein J0I96_11045 [Rhodanobacter sp.]|nr:hypothetical protein [Rhodanobacter sp.]